MSMTRKPRGGPQGDPPRYGVSRPVNLDPRAIVPIDHSETRQQVEEIKKFYRKATP